MGLQAIQTREANRKLDGGFGGGAEDDNWNPSAAFEAFAKGYESMRRSSELERSLRRLAQAGIHDETVVPVAETGEQMSAAQYARHLAGEAVASFAEVEQHGGAGAVEFFARNYMRSVIGLNTGVEQVDG